MARVLCGVDKNGIEHDEPNYGADMRELDRGRWIELPNDVTGHGTVRFRLVGWDLAIAADYLGKHSVLPFSEGARAHRYTRLNILHVYIYMLYND